MATAEAAAPASVTASTRRRLRRVAPTAHPDREDQRPQQVELLLDRERPQVLEQRRPSDGLEVGLLPEHEVPVRHVPEGGQRVAAQSGHLARQKDDRVGEGDDEQQVERRQEPAGAAQPERLQVDAAPSSPLREQQRGDEVAADHEEDLDPEETAGDPGQISVVKEHGDDRERAQPVEAGPVGQPDAPDPAGAELPGADALYF